VNTLVERALLRARALQSGDKIGVIAPASSFNKEAFLKGCERLRSMGYEPVYSGDIFDRDCYFAGPHERRRREFHDFLLRDDIAAIFCARGGYGSNYLLETLNFDAVSKHPKILLGCSDITSLLTVIADRTGLITFHGPMVAGDFARDTVELSSFQNAVQGTSNWAIPTAGVETLRPGHARGKLYGGCLSILVASLGTPFEMQTAGTILFLEDIGEKPYRIDRMLMQLRLAGKLADVGGIIFGEMLGCIQPQGQDYTLQQVILRALHDFKGPIVFGLKSGHVSGSNITVPLGVQAELQGTGSAVELKILEAATKSR